MLAIHGWPARCAALGRGRFSYVLALCAAWFCTAASLNGAALNIVARTSGASPAVTIATLNPNVTAGGVQTGTLTMDAAYRWRMSDADNAQFRFFQMITYDDEPVKWKTNIIVPAGTANHTKSVVDIPKDGWDYQYTQGNMGGGDTSPFYENDTENNASSNPYYYPGYGSRHTADGTNPGISWTDDVPGLGGASHKTLFETFICFENTTILGAKQVNLLGGYTWGIQTDASSVKTGIAPVNVAFADINAALLTEVQDALNRSGYADWTAVANNIIIPEPMTGLFAYGGVLVCICRRRR